MDRKPTTDASAGRARELLARWYPAIVFTVAVVLLMPKALAGQATYVAVDMVETNSPYREELGRPPDVGSPIQSDQEEHLPLTLKFVDELTSGELQLWEPRIDVGTPTAAAFPWLASPFNAVYALLPDWYATTLDAALTLLAAELFMFLFLRGLGLGRAAATFGAVAYAFTGTNMIFIQRPFGAVALLPGLLWAVQRAFERQSIPRLLVVGLLVAWSWFEGFPAAFAYCIYTAALWTVWLGYRRLRRSGVHWSWPALRSAAAPVVKVGVAFAWGMALSAVTLIPFVTEVTGREILDLRPTDMNAHLPTVYVWSLFDLSVNGDPLDPAKWWAGLNPFESVTMVGSVVLAAAFAGLVPAIGRRLRLSAAGRDAWPFFAFVPPALTFVIFIGTPLLGALYLLPGIAHNPISRARFLIALGLCVLAALHLDAALRRRERGERVPTGAALVVAAIWLLIAALTADDVVDGFTGPGPTGDWIEGIGVGLLFVLAGAGVLFIYLRRRIPAAVVGVALAALVFAQVAWPLRNFTPQSPVEDFYPRTDGHAELERLTDGRYRFAADVWSFYPNSSQLTELYDLRGVGLYDDSLRALIESATPTTFARDPFKQVLLPDEWRLDAPAYDDLALGYFALGTANGPYGERIDVHGKWDQWQPAPLDIEVRVPARRELAGLALPLTTRGDCGSALARYRLFDRGRLLDSAERPAYDAAGSWIPMGLVGRRARSSTLTVTVDARGGEGCELLVGASRSGDVAQRLYLEDPDDGVRLVATEGAWIYQRPTAWPLVSAHTGWRWFDDQASALEALRERPPSERDVVYLVGEGGDQPAAGRATVREVQIADASVEARVRAPARSLLVLSQDSSDGWSVAVDGESADMQSVDGALMGVFVEPGVHEVRFEYLPRSVVAGAGTTLVSALLGLGIFVWARRRGAARSRGELAE